MTSFEPSTTARPRPAEDHLEVVYDPPAGAAAACVVCGAPLDEAACCSFACVRGARRELDDNVARLRVLQSHDGPAATRARLTERNGRLTAALMSWRQM